jgi:hypothetical protein
VLDVSESVYGVTAVVEREARPAIKVNNYYSLGGSASLEHERNQALMPLLTHPDPRSVFFLGMGTGITAGAAVQPPVERIVVAELIPDVVDRRAAALPRVRQRALRRPARRDRRGRRPQPPRGRARPLRPDHLGPVRAVGGRHRQPLHARALRRRRASGSPPAARSSSGCRSTRCRAASS